MKERFVVQNFQVKSSKVKVIWVVQTVLPVRPVAPCPRDQCTSYVGKMQPMIDVCHFKVKDRRSGTWVVRSFCHVCPIVLCLLEWIASHVHYNDTIMGAITSKITSLTIVYSGADQRKHQSSASLAFVRGIHRSPVNSPHKWPVTRKMIPFDDVIMSTNITREVAVCQAPFTGKK